MSMPVGIVRGNWDSSAIIGEIFGILTGDLLGYHVAYGLGKRNEQKTDQNS